MRSSETLRKKRFEHVSTTTIRLAVPVLAIALTGAAAVAQSAVAAPGASAGTGPNALTLSVAPRVKFNHPVTATGQAPSSDSGRTIMLETAPAGEISWRPLATSTIAPGGGFTLRAPLRRSGVVRVVESAPTSGSGGPSAFAADQAGAAAVASSAAQPVAVAAQLRVAHHSLDVLSGDAIKIRGRLVPGVAGRDVQLQGRSAGGWRTLARAHTGAAGGFRLRARPTSGLQRRMRVVFAGDGSNARSVAPAGQLTVYNASVASWYDDSGATGCGFHAGFGVANVSLPCGTKVRFHYGGRSVTAVVDDRGPYVGGRTWDLNQNTAAALGFSGVATVWATQ